MLGRALDFPQEVDGEFESISLGLKRQGDVGWHVDDEEVLTNAL